MKFPILTLLIASLPLVGADAPKPGGLKLQADNVSMKFGLLFQPQFEASESQDMEGTKQDLFVRRARLMWSGSLGKSFSFFVETDSTNVGKSNPTGGTKSFNDIKLQDIVLTYKINESLDLDGGLLLVPSAHLSNQGATSLNGLDYSTYAFEQNKMMDGTAGRDTGVMMRGIFFQKHLQAKLGVFQGKREKETPETQASRNAMRVAGRVQFNFLDAEEGLFLAGTYGGTKEVLSVGVAHDRQGDYKMTALDAFMEFPVGDDVLTAQVDHWSQEGTGFWTLPKRKALYTEVSYRFRPLEIAPIFRFEKRTMDAPTVARPNETDETRTGLGLAWWFMGHNSNLKLYWQKVKPEAQGTTLKTYNQFTAQWQMFYF